MQYVDEAVAAVWADGAAAKEEIGDQPGSVRSAVALGRCLLEPLPVLASLCGAQRLPVTVACGVAATCLRCCTPRVMQQGTRCSRFGLALGADARSSNRWQGRRQQLQGAARGRHMSVKSLLLLGFTVKG